MRFGGGKLSAPFRGKPLILHALDRAREAPVEAVTVALGCDSSRLMPLIEASRGHPPVSIVEVEDWQSGLSASLKAAIRAVPENVAAAFIFLGDMPDVPTALCPDLIAAIRNGASAAIPDHQGTPGHPALLSRSLFPAIMDLTGDQGAGTLLRTLGDRLTRLPAPQAAVFDIDRQDDLCGRARYGGE
jgi:molybdenum cofactor cytidylyltransferase